MEKMFNHAFGIGSLRITGKHADLGISCYEGATRKLLKARWMRCMVLPMTVTSHNKEIATLELVIDQPIKKLVSLMLKTF